MTLLRRRPHNLFIHPIGVSVLLVCALCSGARAQNVILYLKSGDRVSGRIVSEYTNRVVLSNSWTKELSVPLAEIAQREIFLASGTNQLGTNHLGTNAIAKIKLPAP